MEIRRVRDGGLRVPGRRVVLYVAPETATSRAAFVVGRRVGGAVVRNRARRVLREAWRRVAPTLSDQVRVVVVARPAIRGTKTQEVEAEMQELLTRPARARR